MARRPMTKAEAVGLVVDVSRQANQPAPPTFRRLVRAFETLGLSVEDMREACRGLDICNTAGLCYRADLRDLAPWARRPAKGVA
jgi:hypothetical protein